MATVNGTVAVDDDNCQIYYSAGWGLTKGGTIWFGRYGTYPEFSAIRFTLDAAIPSGATISSASLSCYGDSNHDVHDWWAYVTESADGPQVTAAGERPTWAASGSTTTYPSTEEGAGAFHDTTGDWAVGSWNTKDMVTLVQHLVDTYGGLASGAHIVIWMAGDNGYTDGTENGFFGHAHGSLYPTLTINYTSGPASTQRIVYESFVGGAQAAPGWPLPTMILINGWDVTLTKISGTDRTIPWSIRKIVSGAISEAFTNSASIGGTEWSLPANAAYSSGSPQTADGIYQSWIDLNALAAGDTYRLRIYEKMTS